MEVDVNITVLNGLESKKYVEFTIWYPKSSSFFGLTWEKKPRGKYKLTYIHCKNITLKYTHDDFDKEALKVRDIIKALLSYRKLDIY